MMTAWNYGKLCQKVFLLVRTLGGTSYIRSLQGPLGNIPLVPTGGVTLENAEIFLQVGTA